MKLKTFSYEFESDQLLEMLDESILMVSFYDEEGNVFKVNKTWVDFFQIPAEDVIGKYNIYQDPLFFKWGLNHYWEQLQTKKFVDTCEFEYDPKELGFDGNTVWLKGRFGKVTNKKKDTSFYYFQMENITEKKKLENFLIRSQKWESIQNLAGGVAHDLNNILTSFSGIVSLIKEEFSNQPHEFQNLMDLMDLLENGVHNGTKLASQLLSISKDQFADKKYINTSKFIMQSVNFVLSGKQTQANFILEDLLWAVYIDPDQISQVIQNVVINASESMNNSGIIDVLAKNIWIGNENLEKLGEGEYILLEIKDHGIGMSENQLIHIYDYFITTKAKGNGLGVPISQNIIKRHNGIMKYKSEPKIGTSVFIYLPANSEIKEYQAEIQKKVSKLKGKILVLDDDKNICHMLSQMCKFLTLECNTYRNSKDALKEFSSAIKTNFPYEIVLTDLTLPGDISGNDFFQEILKVNPNTKGIIMSGYSNNDVLNNYKKYGFSDRIRKPFTLTDFAYKIDFLLKN